MFQRYLTKQINPVELSEALLWLSKLLYQYYQQKLYIRCQITDEKFVSGQPVTVQVNATMRFDQVRTDKSMLWNLLLSAGYLTLKSAAPQKSYFVCDVFILNQEVLGLYEDIFFTVAHPK
jgi:hypothetical protein